MVFIWIGNLFSFESIHCAGKKERRTDEGSGRQERASADPGPTGGTQADGAECGSDSAQSKVLNWHRCLFVRRFLLMCFKDSAFTHG